MRDVLLDFVASALALPVLASPPSAGPVARGEAPVLLTWSGQMKVVFMQADPVYLTDEGYRFFRPRQESFYLIR